MRASLRPALVLVLALLAGCVAPRVRHVDRLDHYATTVKTDDGWELAIFRVPPADPRAHGTPVVLWHGTSVNRFEYLTEGSDFASYLSGRGFDVWIPEYRGDRTSRGPEYRSGDWDVDDIVRHDVPAILTKIQVDTKREQVVWVGHSLGGILGYMTMQGPEADAVAALVTVGAPAAWTHETDLARKAMRLQGFVPKVGQVPTRGLARAMRTVVDLAPDDPLLHALYNLDNIDQRALLGFLRDGFENVGRGTVAQYYRWVEAGTIVSADGRKDYTAGLAEVTIPALVIAGRVDHIAPAWTVRAGHDALGSDDKTWVVLGEGWGQHNDYGHADLMLGDWAEDEVFPVIADWIDARRP